MFLQVLVRNIPPDADESVSEHVEHFFCVNHSNHYLRHQVCRWLCLNLMMRSLTDNSKEKVCTRRFLCSYAAFQLIYNANDLAKLVEKKKSLHNWRTYYQTRYERKQKRRRPRTRVHLLIFKTISSHQDIFVLQVENMSSVSFGTAL